jgi:23S rRNA pseudouridine955/2504/2580 synthase
MSAIRKGQVRLDAVRAREAGTRVSSGQELYVPWEPPDAEAKRAGERRWGTVPVLWRGENVAVIDKPANLLVQPDVKGGDSVVTRIWGMFAHDSLGFSLGFSPAAVHRLDRNTTGVLVVALSGEALRELERLFRERLIAKRYLAVVVGSLPDEGLIDVPLLKDEARNMVTAGAGKKAGEKGEKTARTRYRRLPARGDLFADGSLSLASIELLTGRTHQARAHMAYIGHPILGDRKYGNIEMNRRMKHVGRPMLHAAELEFPGGLSGALLEVSGRKFRSKPPEDMAIFLGGEDFGNLTL